jgi:hypothetical protein
VTRFHRAQPIRVADRRRASITAVHAPASDEAVLTLSSRYCNATTRKPVVYDTSQAAAAVKGEMAEAATVLPRRLSAVDGSGDASARARRASAVVVPLAGAGGRAPGATTDDPAASRRRSSAAAAAASTPLADVKTVALADGRRGVQIEEGVVAVVRRSDTGIGEGRRPSTSVSASVSAAAAASARRASVTQGASTPGQLARAPVAAAVATQQRRPSASGAAAAAVATPQRRPSASGGAADSGRYGAARS